MRKHPRRRASLAVLSLSAVLLLAGVAPASAHSSYDQPATAENLEALRWCESTNDYGIDTGNGYYGAYQFSLETWEWMGYAGYPHEAPPEVQDQAALDLYHYAGWSPWPACSDWLGLSG